MENEFDPELIFKEADAFLLSYEALIQNQSKFAIKLDDKALWLTRAANVNHAFAFELYLKCLLCIENIEAGGEHKLTKLFSLLSQETKEKIILDFDKSTGMTPSMGDIMFAPKKPDFIKLLRETPEPFYLLRYKYERGRKAYRYNLHDAIKSVRNVILLLKPDINGLA